MTTSEVATMWQCATYATQGSQLAPLDVITKVEPRVPAMKLLTQMADTHKISDTQVAIASYTVDAYGGKSHYLDHHKWPP